MFHPDKPIGKILSSLFDQMMLSILFLICSMPIITMGAAAIALYEVQFSIQEYRDTNIFKMYFVSLWKNLKSGLLTMLLLVLISVAAIGILSSTMILNLPIKTVVIILVAVVLCFGSWLIPLLARFDQKFFITFQNAYLLSFQKLPITLAMALINALPFLLIWITPDELLNGFVFVSLFLFPGYASLACSGLFLQAIEKLNVNTP